MLFLESDEPDQDIYLYINSPGGHVSSGLAIYDTMQYIKPDVQTICLGQAASMVIHLHSRMRREKTLDQLIDQVKVTEEMVDRSELEVNN